MSLSMSDGVYRSSGLYGWFIPVATVCLGVMCVGAGVVFLVARADWQGFLALAAMGGGLVALFLASRGKFGSVVVGPDGVVVNQNGAEFTFGWRDVRSFRTVPFVTPPVYRLTFYGSDLVTYFVPVSSASLNVGVWTFHFGGMGKYIRSQLRGVGLYS